MAIQPAGVVVAEPPAGHQAHATIAPAPAGGVGDTGTPASTDVATESPSTWVATGIGCGRDSKQGADVTIRLQTSSPPPRDDTAATRMVEDAVRAKIQELAATNQHVRDAPEKCLPMLNRECMQVAREIQQRERMAAIKRRETILQEAGPAVAALLDRYLIACRQEFALTGADNPGGIDAMVRRLTGIVNPVEPEAEFVNSNGFSVSHRRY